MKAKDLKENTVYYVEGIQLAEEGKQNDFGRSKDDVLRKVIVIYKSSPIVELAALGRFANDTFLLRNEWDVNVLVEREVDAESEIDIERVKMRKPIF